MKNSSKLLTILLALAMVMSVVVMPVSATDEAQPQPPQPLYDNGFETKEVGATQSVQSGSSISAVVADVTTEGITLREGGSGSKVLKVTGTNDAVAMVRFNNISDLMEINKTYEVSGYILAVPEGTNTSSFWFDTAGSSMSTLAPTITEQNKVTPSDSWQKVTSTFTVGASSYTAATGNMFSIVTYVARNATVAFYLDDVQVKEIPPEATVNVTGVEEGVDVVAENGVELTYEFSNAPYKFENANVDVTPAANVSVTKVSDTQYTVAISGLGHGEDYTVALTDVIDMYAQDFASTVNFTTAPFYLSSDNVIPTASRITSVTDLSDRTCTTTRDGDTWNASFVKKDYAITAGIGAGGEWEYVKVDPGKRYIMCAQIRNDDASPSNSATGFIGVENKKNQHLYTISEANDDPSVYLNDNEWHTIYSVAVTTAATCTCSDSTNCSYSTEGILARAVVNKHVNSFSVKDFQMRELTALNIDNTCYGTVVRNDDDATLFIEATGKDKEKIYFAAVSYNGTKATAIKFDSAELSSSFPVAKLDIELGDNYKIMVWDENLNPLCNTFLGSDL